jgi:hypothetical protein
MHGEGTLAAADRKAVLLHGCKRLGPQQERHREIRFREMRAEEPTD